MKTLQKTLFALAAGSLLSVSAQAAVTYGNGYTGQPYVGVKVGQFMVDDDNLDNATAYGVYGGYNFDSNFGVELEYVGSSDTDVDTNGVDGEYDLKTYGAYGTYRYAFPNTGLYAKGKLGIAKTKADLSVRDNFGNSANVSDSDTGVAGGIGLGYMVTPNMNVEAEYALIDSDADLLTVGAHLKFQTVYLFESK